MLSRQVVVFMTLCCFIVFCVLCTSHGLPSQKHNKDWLNHRRLKMHDVTKRAAAMTHSQKMAKAARLRALRREVEENQRLESFQPAASIAGLRRRYAFYEPNNIHEEINNNTSWNSSLVTSDSLESHFRPLEVPREHLVPFQEFGKKLRTASERHTKTPSEDERAEEMDVSFTRAFTETNKVSRPHHIMVIRHGNRRIHIANNKTATLHINNGTDEVIVTLDDEEMTKEVVEDQNPLTLSSTNTTDVEENGGAFVQTNSTLDSVAESSVVNETISLPASVNATKPNQRLEDVLTTTAKPNRTSTGFTLLHRTREQIHGAKKNMTLAKLGREIAEPAAPRRAVLVDNAILKHTRGNTTYKSSLTRRAPKMIKLEATTTKTTSKILSTAVVTSISVLGDWSTHDDTTVNMTPRTRTRQSVSENSPDEGQNEKRELKWETPAPTSSTARVDAMLVPVDHSVLDEVQLNLRDGITTPFTEYIQRYGTAKTATTTPTESTPRSVTARTTATTPFEYTPARYVTVRTTTTTPSENSPRYGIARTTATTPPENTPKYGTARPTTTTPPENTRRYGTASTTAATSSEHTPRYGTARTTTTTSSEFTPRYGTARTTTTTPSEHIPRYGAARTTTTTSLEHTPRYNTARTTTVRPIPPALPEHRDEAMLHPVNETQTKVHVPFPVTSIPPRETAEKILHPVPTDKSRAEDIKYPGVNIVKTQDDSRVVVTTKPPVVEEILHPVVNVVNTQVDRSASITSKQTEVEGIFHPAVIVEKTREHPQVFTTSKRPEVEEILHPVVHVEKLKESSPGITESNYEDVRQPAMVEEILTPVIITEDEQAHVDTDIQRPVTTNTLKQVEADNIAITTSAPQFDESILHPVNVESDVTLTTISAEEVSRARASGRDVTRTEETSSDQMRNEETTISQMREEHTSSDPVRNEQTLSDRIRTKNVSSEDTLRVRVLDSSKDEVTTEDVDESNVASYVLGSISLIPVMVAVFLAVKYCITRRKKIWESEKSPLTFVTANEWEFPRNKLRLQTVLGQGNFGLVYKAEADDILGERATRLVAVKTIKDNASSREKEDLMRELSILKQVGAHSNVVTLFACCTEKEPYLLIMEYVMYGKLLSFLRDNRTRKQYFNFSEDGSELTAKDLTSFAYCVARGMEYLVTKGIIHRDLAARNILVDHNKICKVADFGMSRSVSEPDQIYEQARTKGALPIRWMAPESLAYRVFTHKSDVWAFGILMWEIITLGSTPYPSLCARDVLREVCSGYRLERPTHCRPELYRVAATCWSHDPAERPSFTEVKAALAILLEQGEPQTYVDLESYIESISNSRSAHAAM